MMTGAIPPTSPGLFYLRIIENGLRSPNVNSSVRLAAAHSKQTLGFSRMEAWQVLLDQDQNTPPPFTLEDLGVNRAVLLVFIGAAGPSGMEAPRLAWPDLHWLSGSRSATRGALVF